MMNPTNNKDSSFPPSSGGGNRRPSFVVDNSSANVADEKMTTMSDLELERRDLNEQHHFASELLDQLGRMLDGADDVVTNLEDDSGLLPTAILRRCTEFADLVGRLAGQLEGQSDEEREELANAIHQDFVQLQKDQQAISSAAAAEFEAYYHRKEGLELHEGLEPPESTFTTTASATSATTNNHPEISTSPASTASSFSTAPLVSPSPTTSTNIFHRTSGGDSDNQFGTTHPETETVEVQPNDILRALSGVSCLLRDVESSFRDIGRSEAEELADVGLTLARLFLMSLQNLYETLTPENVVEAATAATAQIQEGNNSSYHGFYPPPQSATKTRSSVVIEELSAEDSFFVSSSSGGGGFDGDETSIDENHPANNNVDWSSSLNSIRRDLDLDDNAGGSSSRNAKQTPGSTAASASATSSSSRAKTKQKARRSSRNNTISSNEKKRLRCLWPPIGPRVSHAMGWTKTEAGRHPVLAVALGLTLWPVAVAAAVAGTGAAAVDGAVQDVYDRFSDGPLLSNLERGAAQLYQTGRLGFVTGKLVTRQTVRVVSRQVERQGGVGPVLDKVREGVVDRIVHPVETVGMVWDGLNVCVGFVQETAGHVIAMRQESNQTAQELS